MIPVVQEANRIKERLRACTTVDEVNQVADEERATVMGWKDKGGNQGAMFYHIASLKKYMIGKIERGHNGR
jgi:hypothetical protein